jgi:nucleoid DNA-binding protein
MNKSDLIDVIAKQADISKAKARIALDAAIKGLGSPARRRSTSKNPSAAEARLARFKPGKVLRDL